MEKSVPFYNVSHDIVLKLPHMSLFSLNIRYYDIGCSTGTLIQKIYNKNKDKTLKLA